MRILTFISLVGAVSCSSPPSTDSSPTSDEVRQVVRGLLSPSRLIIYLSARDLSDDERSAIDSGQKLGIGCTRLELPNAAAFGASYSMSGDPGLSFSHEWPTRDPYSDDPITMRIHFASREEGLIGNVTTETDGTKLRVAYQVKFSGYKSFYDEKDRYIEFDASNVAVLAPEVMR